MIVSEWFIVGSCYLDTFIFRTSKFFLTDDGKLAEEVITNGEVGYFNPSMNTFLAIWVFIVNYFRIKSTVLLEYIAHTKSYHIHANRVPFNNHLDIYLEQEYLPILSIQWVKGGFWIWTQGGCKFSALFIPSAARYFDTTKWAARSAAGKILCFYDVFTVFFIVFEVTFVK